MKKPKDGDIITIKEELNELSQSQLTELENNTWGSYDKNTKTWSPTIFSGKVIRKWIQNKFKQLFTNSIKSIAAQSNKKLSPEGLQYYTSQIENINYNIYNQNGEQMGTFIAAARVYNSATTYKYSLVTNIPASINYTITQNQSSKLGNLSGWSNFKGKSDQYIILEPKSGKTNIGDYLTVTDTLGGILTNSFIITSITNYVAIKWNGLTPLDDSDANITITFK